MMDVDKSISTMEA